MRLLIKYLTIIGVLLASFSTSAFAENALEKKDVTLSVGGQALFYYLPLAIADQKGFFKEEGLNVTIIDFKGGSQSLQALIGGSADATTGSYEQVLRMQQRGQEIRALIELDHTPAIVLAVRNDLTDKIKSPADLKGMKIGVTAPGSSTNNFANYVLNKYGVKPEEVSFIGVGAGATAIVAMKRGEIDAIVNLDPVISNLVHDGDISVLVDTRTKKGLEDLLGASSMSSAVLYTKDDFVKNNPNTAQALTNGLYKALRWLQTATPEEIANTVPASFIGNNRQIYLESVASSLQTYSPNGMFSDEGMQAALKLLSADPAIANAKIDLTKTIDDRFVKKANEKP